MARAATAPELAKFRGADQWSELGLAIQPATSLYTARINQTFTSLDSVAELTYDTGSGTLANVLEGMSMWVGSAAGLYDKGIVRIRKAPTATKFYIGETSEIQFADNDYLTVVNVFTPWQRHLTQTGRVTRMDYDLAFPTATGGYAPPVPVMGPIAAVLRLTGATVDFSPPTAATSYSQISSIASYAHTATGSSASSGMTTATPTITYNAAGTYRRDLTVTDANGITGTGHRWVFVNPTNPVFTLKSCSGDFESGGWSFEVECFSGVSAVVPGALVALWARDFYGGVEGSIGPVSAHENIIAAGWIAEESINYDPEQGSVTFTVRSLDWWLDQESAYPVGLFDNAAPDVWTEFPTLTVDDIMFHFLYWRSTATKIADCILSGDTKRMRYINVPTGSLWSQLVDMADNTIFAKPMVNALGQLYVQIDLNLLPTASRSTIPVVQDLTTSDWLEVIDLQRHTTPELGFVELSGVGSYNGTTAAPLFSRAPGTVAKHYGHPEAPGNHLFTDQSDCNRLAGALLAEANAEYELTVKLTNQRLFDITPHQYATISIAAGDTPRGITLTTQNFVPRRVEYEHDPDRGNITATVFFVSETIGVDGITYVPPQPPNPSTPPVVPPIVDIPPIIIGGGTLPPPVIPPPPGDTGSCSGADLDTPGETFFLNWDRTHLDAADPDEERHAYAWFPVTLRPSSATFPTTFHMSWTGYDFSNNYTVLLSHLHVYAIDSSKNRLLTATPGGSIYDWSLTTVSALPIAGFEVYLDDDGDTDFTGWARGAFISSLGVSSLLSSGVDTPALTPGNWYCWSAISLIYGWKESGGGLFRSDCQFDFSDSGSWTGRVGAVDTVGFFSDLPTNGWHVDPDPDGSSYNIFFIATSTVAHIRVYSSSFGDNVDVNGGLNGTFHDATLTGTRYVDLGETYIQSPCGTT